MTALVNGLLWFAMFAIPMLIAVIPRRRARKYGLDNRGTLRKAVARSALFDRATATSCFGC